VELLSIGLLFSVKTRTISSILVEHLRNRLGNGISNILPNRVSLKNGSSIEALAFQPNCKWAHFIYLLLYNTSAEHVY